MPRTFYCTADDVAQFLMFNQPTGFDDYTKPTRSQVEEIINRSEDEIDRYCCTTFRRPFAQISEYEYHNIETKYRWFTGIAIYLRRRPVDFIFVGNDVGIGVDGRVYYNWDWKEDVLEVWNGNAYEPFNLSNQSRIRDWWVDVDQGILYFRCFIYLRRPLGIRVKYHYGHMEVPGDIKRACIYLTCADLISGEDRSVLLPEGTDNLSYRDKVDMWRERAYEILYRYREWRTVGEIF